jgi:glycosyltransferase involved in cell wall biosynthesis
VSERAVSVVINTYQRAESLGRTLGALGALDYPRFEVIVVNGPSTDATEEVLASYAGKIKTDRCPQRNLSSSRNLGIRLAAGEIVAFIDDDAYPDPAWLDRLVEAYDDAEVGAAGGPTYNYTGTVIQAWYSFVDRLGNASVEFDPGSIVPAFVNTPFTHTIPYTIGTNASFRRSTLVELGGFDEEYEYYLEESDLCCRLIGHGSVVRQLDDGFVYHKFLPSWVRERPDVVKDYRQVLKSKFYFALRHGLLVKSFLEVCSDIERFAQLCGLAVASDEEAGLLGPADRVKFETDVKEASDEAIAAYVRGPRTRPSRWFDTRRQPFLPFPTRGPASEKLHVCLLSNEYPPTRVNGIGRVVHSLAVGLADAGHVVEVLTRGEGHPRVDLEEGVWVHRVPVAPGAAGAPEGVPAHLWDYSAAMLGELERIDAHRPVDIVQAPNWDSEGIAVLEAGRWPLVVGLYTPLATLIAQDPVFGAALAAGDVNLRQMVALETRLYGRAQGVLACGPAIIEEVESRCDTSFEASRVGLVPHGLSDARAEWGPRLGRLDAGASHGAGVGGDAAEGDAVKILFVGRLEARKGIDVLLDCVETVTEEHPDVTFLIAGDDTLPSPGPMSYRAAFEQTRPGSVVSAVRFLGPVEDAELYRLYDDCDIVVVPSRFESFGLMLLEAMIFAKPVVAARVGGMAEIVVDGETGLLVSPGEPGPLAAALSRLIASAPLRRAMGDAGRRLFEDRYTRRAMVSGVVSFYRSLLATAGATTTAPSTPSPDLHERMVNG